MFFVGQTLSAMHSMLLIIPRYKTNTPIAQISASSFAFVTLCGAGHENENCTTRKIEMTLSLHYAPPLHQVKDSILTESNWIVFK